jgi:nicotinamidase-related amidase
VNRRRIEINKLNITEAHHMPRALLVIDVQNEYFSGKLPVSYPPGSLENILRAILVTQGMLFSKIMKTAEWIQEISRHK